MNAHVNLGALRCARLAGKVGAEPAPSTPRKSPAEEGMITAEFAVALPAVTRPLPGGRLHGGCATQSGGVCANGRTSRRPRRF
mgnify:CR=1 FL=1